MKASTRQRPPRKRPRALNRTSRRRPGCLGKCNRRCAPATEPWHGSFWVCIVAITDVVHSMRKLRLPRYLLSVRWGAPSRPGAPLHASLGNSQNRRSTLGFVNRAVPKAMDHISTGHVSNDRIWMDGKHPLPSPTTEPIQQEVPDEQVRKLGMG